MAFFRPLGWAPAEVRWSSDESHRLGREMRLMWLWRLVGRRYPKPRREAFRRMSGFVLLQREVWMRRLRYQVAMSLDGCIAGPHGEYDWITTDPSIDFGALWREFDLFVMGRRTWEVIRSQGDGGLFAGKQLVVFSHTLTRLDWPNATVTAEDPARAVARFKEERGKDIWLFGGGILFRTLLDAGLVDAVEIALMPTLVGGGVPVIAPGDTVRDLQLVTTKVLPSGIIMLGYGPLRAGGRAAP